MKQTTHLTLPAGPDLSSGQEVVPNDTILFQNQGCRYT